MALLMVDQGEGIALEYIVNKDSPEDLVLRLFKNDKTPADADDEGDYTEADFTGYSSITLTGSSWTVTPGAPSQASYAQQTFASTADQSQQLIYGYYLTRLTGGELMWAERFTDGPYAIANNGDQIKVTPKLQAKKSGE